ncbi:MAG: tRNA pseudouridine(38-40) synthase TruA [Fibrobacteres bacterium]|nr:tRNA pseudouridine(38-40) synthase TruA [Fibrobacterota bacterium]
MNIRLDIEYDGSLYHGWQIQNNASSVQESIEKALSTIFRTPISIIGAGRTDTGVHARGQVANFSVDSLPTSLGQLGRSINGLVREGITIHKVSIVPDEFHARYSALSRSYIYSVSRIKRSIDRQMFYSIVYDVDIDRMIKCIPSFLGTHDFKQFCVDAGKKSTMCTVMNLSIAEESEIIRFHITANRFLHKMVRMVVGTLLAVGKGHIDKTVIDELVAGKRGSRSFCAPAHALCLTNVEYPPELNATMAAKPWGHQESLLK